MSRVRFDMLIRGHERTHPADKRTHRGAAVERLQLAAGRVCNNAGSAWTELSARLRQ